MIKPNIVLPLKLTAVSLAAMSLSAPVLADHSHEHNLEQKIDKLNKRIEQLEAKKTPSKFKNSSFTFYGSLRPTLEYNTNGNNSDKDFDVADALSNIGVSASTEFMDGWKAIAQGEWSVDLSNNGNFGKARQVYTAISSPYGQVGFGKQRPAQYSLIAEYLDIFNSASSPYAYEKYGPFFINNFVTYKLNFNKFTLMAATQVNGNDGHFNNVGLGYDNDGLHLGIGYVDETAEDDMQGVKYQGDKDILGATVAYTFDNDLYLAASYNKIDFDFENNALDRDARTIDTALAYPFMKNYKVKLGYFDNDDGKKGQDSLSFNGFNTTLEWNPVNNVRLHIEYLTRNYDNVSDDKILAVGIRYDFRMKW